VTNGRTLTDSATPPRLSRVGVKIVFVAVDVSVSYLLYEFDELQKCSLALRAVGAQRRQELLVLIARGLGVDTSAASANNGFFVSHLCP
jgi:hypothetical protein